jgi:cell division protein FtsL
MKNIVFWLLFALIFVSALGVVMSRHEARKLFVEIQALEKTRDDLNEEWTRLLLEQSTWATDVRIETMARTGLGMQPPVNPVLVFEK